MLSSRAWKHASGRSQFRSLSSGIRQQTKLQPLLFSQHPSNNIYSTSLLEGGFQRLLTRNYTERINLSSVLRRGFATTSEEKKEDEKSKSSQEEKSEEEPAKMEKDDAPASNKESNEDQRQEGESSGDSLRDSINRMKRKEKDKEGREAEQSSDGGGDFIQKASTFFDRFKKEVGEAWQELLKSGERKDINKKIKRPEATAEGEKEYTGPVDIMVIDESEHLTAWERMQKRLTEAPVIQDVLSKAEGVYVKSGAKDAKEKIDHLREDAREAWETSQNPWVYRASSVYDTLTAETAESVAVKELRQLDPEFTLEDWRRDVVGYTLPQIMEWFLQGKINQLKPWLGEGVFNRIASEITARKQEGVQIDTHVLGIMNSEILAVEPDEVNKGSPIIVLHFMCQQINCVRKKDTGEIVEGSEDDIRANSYVCAFQREYNEEEGELNWKIVDFRFNGAIAYL